MPPPKDYWIVRDHWIEGVLREEGTGCRDWPFRGLNWCGYPMVQRGGRTGDKIRIAHLVLERSGRGPRPTGQEVLHSCDRPICCAPWHLRWGTHAENLGEAAARNRFPLGLNHHAAKLADDEVEAIRQDSRLQRVIAAEYGIDPSNVSRIRAGLRRRER